MRARNRAGASRSSAFALLVRGARLGRAARARARFSANPHVSRGAGELRLQWECETRIDLHDTDDRRSPARLSGATSREKALEIEQRPAEKPAGRFVTDSRAERVAQTPGRFPWFALFFLRDLRLRPRLLMALSFSFGSRVNARTEVRKQPRYCLTLGASAREDFITRGPTSRAQGYCAARNCENSPWSTSHVISP